MKGCPGGGDDNTKQIYAYSRNKETELAPANRNKMQYVGDGSKLSSNNEVVCQRTGRTYPYGIINIVTSLQLSPAFPQENPSATTARPCQPWPWRGRR